VVAETLDGRCAGSELLSTLLVGVWRPRRGILDCVVEEDTLSTSVKWAVCAVCAVLGVIAFVYAVIYLAVPIHSLPGFVPGKQSVNGHYHKRALLTGIIGVVLIAVAVIAGISARRGGAEQTSPSSGTQEPSAGKETTAS
jgi:hypothetical protein